MTSVVKYNYEYFLHKDVCRLCLDRNACKLISNTKFQEACVKNELIDQIKDCLGLDILIQKENYPKKICLSCCNQIEQFHTYKTLCRNNDIRLRDIFHKKEENALNESPVSLTDTQTNPTYSDFANTVDSNTTLIKSESCIHTSSYESTDEIINSLQYSDIGSDCEPLLKHRNRKRAKLKLKTINKLSPTYCNICKIDLNYEDKLNVHNIEIHNIENGSFKCLGCDKKFKSAKRRQAHERNFCKNLKDGYRCLECNIYLPSCKMYELHIRDHGNKVQTELPEDLFMCKKCHKTFNTKEELHSHEIVHSTQKKKFICESCGRVFTRQDYLYKHKLTHTGTKQHVCSHCGLRFTQKSSLTVHVRKHTGERPYSCDVCPQRCISSSNLRAHRRRHLGVKKYECIICNRKFGYKISLDEHIASNHAQPQTYPCQYCGATYTRMRGLRRHLLTKHKDKEVKTIDNIEQSGEYDKMLEVADNVEQDGRQYDKMAEVTENEVEKNVGSDYELMVLKDQHSDEFIVQ